MAEKINPLYKLLKEERPINNTSELKKTFHSVDKALSDACELALNSLFRENNSFWWRTPASEALVMPSWLRIIQTKRSNQRGKPMVLWRSDQKYRSVRNLKCPSTRRSFKQSKWHISSLHKFCERRQNHQLCWQIINQSHVSFKRKRLHRNSWTLVIICCNSTSKNTDGWISQHSSWLSLQTRT